MKKPKIGEIVLGEDYYNVIDLYKFCGTHWLVQITSTVWIEIEAPHRWSYINWNN